MDKDVNTTQEITPPVNDANAQPDKSAKSSDPNPLTPSPFPKDGD